MALISTLADTFSGTSLGSKWSASIPPSPGGSTVTVGGGCLNLTQNVKAVSVYSVDPYDFSGSGFYAVFNPPIMFSVSGGSFPELSITESTVTLKNNLSTVASIPYVATDMGMVRMMFSGSTMTAAYSKDNITWVDIGSTTVTVPTNATLQIQVGVAGKTGRIHSFNTVENRRDVVNTGLFSSRNTWSNVAGGHPGALVPTSSSLVWLETAKNLELDSDAHVSYFYFYTGGLDLGGHKLTCDNSCVIAGGGSKTLTATNGTIRSPGIYAPGSVSIIGASSLTLEVDPSSASHEYTFDNSYTIGHLSILHNSTGSTSLSLMTPVKANLLSIEDEGSLTVDFTGATEVTHFRSLRPSIGGRTTINAPSGFKFTGSGTCSTARTDIFTTSMLSADGGNTYFPLYLNNDLANTTIGNIIKAAPGPGGSLKDDFEGVSLDSSLWTSSTHGAGYVNVASGVLTLGYSGGTSGFSLTAKKSYNIVESPIEFEVSACYSDNISIELLGSKTFGLNDTFKPINSFDPQQYRIWASDTGGDATVQFDRKVDDEWVMVSGFSTRKDLVRAVRPLIWGERNVKDDVLVISRFGATATANTNGFLAFFGGV